jgi:hypothetical protein
VKEFCWDTGSGINYFNHDCRDVAWKCPETDTRCQLPAVSHGVGSIGEQIQEYLSELLPIRVNGRHIREELWSDLDSSLPQVMQHQLDCLVDLVADIDCRDLIATGPTELEKVPDQTGHPFHLSFNDFQRLSTGVVWWSLGEQSFNSQAHGSEWVVQLVCNARCEFTDTREPSCLPELLSRRAEFFCLGLKFGQNLLSLLGRLAKFFLRLSAFGDIPKNQGMDRLARYFRSRRRDL